MVSQTWFIKTLDFIVVKTGLFARFNLVVSVVLVVSGVKNE